MTFTIRVSIFVIVLLGNINLAGATNHRCVQIFYDKTESPKYTFGRLYALFLQNLLGHFPEWQQIISPIEQYEPGQIEKCDVNFYIGSYYDNPIPTVFYSDFERSQKTVVWLGYGLHRWPDLKYEKIFDVSFNGYSIMDYKNPDSNGEPGFFRDVEYKGEMFSKFKKWDPTDPTKLIAAFEVSRLERLSKNPMVEVPAWTYHSVTQERTPFALRNLNHWYFSEIPFSFIHEEDRYLVFADLLFDILNEKPLRADFRPAVVRIEDIHPLVETWLIEPLMDYFKKENIPYHISVIPVFSDPLGLNKETAPIRMVPLHQYPQMRDLLQRARDEGAGFIYHGVTHQYGNQPNPYRTFSGNDFEFWDAVKNEPVAKDSVKFVVNRLEDGWEIMKRAGIKPLAWLTPHYQASPLDSIIFGYLFNWNLGRITYFPGKIGNVNFPNEYKLDQEGLSSPRMPVGTRLNVLEKVNFEWTEGKLPNGQFYPYEIYGDVYGQKIIPENLGNLQPYINEYVVHTRTIDDLIHTAKKIRVLRDVWGSFFIHPYMLLERRDEGLGEYAGDMKEVIRLITEIKALGYTFISLQDWMNKNKRPLRLKPIEN